MAKSDVERQRACRERKKLGLTQINEWITPELSTLYAKLRSAYENKGKLWDDIVKLMEGYRG